MFSLLFTFFHFFAVNLISGNIEVLRFNLPLLLFTYFHLFSLLFTSFQFCPCVEGGCLLWAGGPHLPVSSAQTSVGDEKCTRSQSLEPEHKLLTQKKIQQIKKRNKQQPTTRKLSGSISEAYVWGWLWCGDRPIHGHPRQFLPTSGQSYLSVRGGSERLGKTSIRLSLAWRAKLRPETMG